MAKPNRKHIDGDLFKAMRRVFATDNLDAPLPYPHYTDMETWRNGQVIFGREQKTSHDAYSDRLRQWDDEAAERASEAVKAKGIAHSTARWHQEWLAAYHGKSVTLRCIVGGVNWSNGFAYYYYSYDVAE